MADDNEVNQKLVAFYLKQQGAEVIVANDGLEAIAAVLRDDADLVLMDMDMPNMDGLTAVRYLREKGFTLPIVAFSGNVDEIAIAEAESAGCNGHLSKPLDLEKLEALLGSLHSSTNGVGFMVAPVRPNNKGDDHPY